MTYNYNQAGWLNSVDGYINGITYNARGQKKLVTYANNLTTTLTYNDPVDRPGAPSDFRLFNRMTSANQQNLTYLYDPVGNITSIDDSLFTASRTFTYDDLNRLETASGTFGSNQSQQDCTGANRYIYNAIGNVTGKCGAALDYNDPLHPSAVTFNSSTGRNYTYDANGNMLTRGTQTLAWDIDNRVTSVTILGGGTTSMQYDYTGMRVKKDAPAGVTLFPFKGYEIAPDGTITKFIRIGNETFASKKRTTGGATTQYFYHNDHLGGVNVITDINGAQAQVDEYDTWGAVSKSVGNIDQTHRFTGQELDPESGLYYYVGRYYDQEIGRFVSPDPFVQAPAEPQTLNRYGYVLNSPQNYIDPSGYEVSSGDGGGSYSGGFFNWWSWYHFFDSLFGGDDKKPHPRPRPKQRTHHQQQIKVENEGRPELENVLVYNSQGPAGNDDPNDDRMIPGRSKQMDRFYRSLSSGNRPGRGKGGALNPDCPPVPAAPCDVSVAANIGVARQHHWDPFWFYNQVRNKIGPWDYKQQGSPRQYENFGNFNYGATGRAAGFPAQVLLRAAGWAAGQAGTSESGHWLGSSPYGDNLIDQAQIQAGIRYYELGCYEY